MATKGAGLGPAAVERAIESTGLLRVENNVHLRSQALRLAFACMLERSSTFHGRVVDELQSEIRHNREIDSFVEALWESESAVESTLRAEETPEVCKLPVDTSPELVRIVWRLEQFTTRESGVPGLIASLASDISDTGLGPLTRSWIRNRQELSNADEEIRTLYLTSEIWTMLSDWLVADIEVAVSVLSAVDVSNLRERARHEANDELVSWWITMKSLELPSAADYPGQVAWGDLLPDQ